MLTVFPFYDGDVDRMMALLEWILDLGGCQNHAALLVADAETDWQRCLEVKKLAEKSFKSVALITNETSVIGWIEGPKSLFLAGAAYAQQHKQPFLQMETDAIPLISSWLDKIQSEYQRCGKFYMGHVYSSNAPQFPPKCLSGIAVYAADVARYQPAIKQGGNWDITLSNYIIPITAHTHLIHHVWGQKNLPPTFVKRTLAAPVNAFLLEDIPKQAVLFHRNKDGTLIELLREKLGLKKSVSA